MLQMHIAPDRKVLECAQAHGEAFAKHDLFVQADKDAREDRANRDPDYDSHLGIERDPVTREIKHIAAST